MSCGLWVIFPRGLTFSSQGRENYFLCQVDMKTSAQGVDWLTLSHISRCVLFIWSFIVFVGLANSSVFDLNFNFLDFQIQFEKWNKVVSSISIFPWIKFVCQAMLFATDDNDNDNDGDNDNGDGYKSIPIF